MIDLSVERCPSFRLFSSSNFPFVRRIFYFFRLLLLSRFPSFHLVLSASIISLRGNIASSLGLVDLLSLISSSLLFFLCPSDSNESIM